MKKYSSKILQQANGGYTDLFILTTSDWVKNAATGHVLTALAVGDIVFRVMTEVVTAVAGPTATLSVGVTSSTTRFTDATDVATATAIPYVVSKATGHTTVGTGFISATSGGAVTTALTNSTSGVVPGAAQTPYVALSAVNLLATATLSNVDVTAGEVWIWAEISRASERRSFQA